MCTCGASWVSAGFDACGSWVVFLLSCVDFVRGICWQCHNDIRVALQKVQGVLFLSVAYPSAIKGGTNSWILW